MPYVQGAEHAAGGVTETAWRVATALNEIAAASQPEPGSPMVLRQMAATVDAAPPDRARGADSD